MLEYPLDFPRDCAGVYALKNKITKQLYVGETIHLVSRYAEWRSAVRGTIPAKSIRLREIFGGTDIRDWVFVVIRELPGATKRELLDAEAEVIRWCVEKHGDLVLNTVLDPETRERQRAAGKKEGNVRLSKVTHNGQELTHREIADILGVRIASISNRLAKRRARGVFEMTLEELADRGVRRPLAEISAIHLTTTQTPP